MYPMRKIKAREALLERYAPLVKSSDRPLVEKKTNKHSTLEEFYREVQMSQAKSFKFQYPNKDASEIESMMRDNRNRIEAERNRRK